MYRRTLTMNFDGLGEDDDEDRFFESYSRISSVTPLDMASSGSDDDEFEDGRLSFASCVSSASFASVGTFKNLDVGLQSSSVLQDYGMWMAEPGDINERRKRLLQGMGLASNKALLKLASGKVVPTLSIKVNIPKDSSTSNPDSDSSSTNEQKHTNVDEPQHEPKPQPQPQPEPPESSPSTAIVLVRSRSDGDILFFSSIAKKRKEQLFGPASKQRLTRTSSVSIAKNNNVGLFQYANSERVPRDNNRCRSLGQNAGELSSLLPEGGFGPFFLIKNLDTGKEFVVKESNEKGMWNKLSDLETGKQLTMEEFEKTVGHSPVVKEMMRREQVYRNADDPKKDQANSYLIKSFRNSKRRGVALLKNLKEVANSVGGLIADKDRENPSTSSDQKATKISSEWVKVRQHGKQYKELTALHLSQEIQAHEGSIWTIKFSSDSRYLASAGEDRVIHVWEVQDCEVLSSRPLDDLNSVSGTPVHPLAASSPERPPLAEITPTPSERRKKGKFSSKKRGNSMPDYVSMPDTVFALSEKPVCTFTGHLDDVLDLSWSLERLLLSSSTDKTVRLWDLETGSCLKLFAHNDYVTCIQFNPVDGDYFISGSLDSKVRIWNVSDRHVVDWIDLHEMVTSASYTPDGQGAVFGCHKGSCRVYTIDDYKLELKEGIEIPIKKKSQAKKVTGIQFSPCNSDEMLITSADSRIRVGYGSEVIHKFKGFRNTSSQISASFTADGKYILSASEDNQVFMWKWEYSKNVGSGKGRVRTSSQAYEYFQCKDVSVAIPWEGSIKNEVPMVEMHSKRHYSKRFISQTPHSPEGCKKQLPPVPNSNSNPKKDVNNSVESISASHDDEFAQSSRTDPGISASDSFASASSSSIRYGDSPSISNSGNSNSNSQSWSSSWSLFDGSSSQGSPIVQATAWGMVIVTATLGGEIRVYQNFGLPLKVGRQTNLFKDLT